MSASGLRSCVSSKTNAEFFFSAAASTLGFDSGLASGLGSDFGSGAASARGVAAGISGLACSPVLFQSAT